MIRTLAAIVALFLVLVTGCCRGQDCVVPPSVSHISISPAPTVTPGH